MKLLKLLPLIGIFILIYIINKIGLINLYKTIITANIFYIILASIFVFLAVLSLTFKWYIILKIQNIHVDFLYALKLYFIGIFYGTITPARAGSIIRASYLKDKTNKPFGECVSSIILERLMDLFVLFTVSIIGCFVFSKYIADWLSTILIVFVIFLIFSFFMLKKNINKSFIRLIYRFLIPEKLKPKSKELYHTFYSNVLSVKKLIYPLILTFITWTIASIPIFFITKAYFVDISFFYIFLINVIGTMISIIPITIGGLGTREATLIFLFSFFNVPAATVVSISFVNLLLGYIIAPLFGFILSLKEKSPERLI